MQFIAATISNDIFKYLAILMIFRDKWEIEIKKHAFIRAKQRKIRGWMIYTTIKGGRIQRFGKDGIKFIMKYKKGELVCVGRMQNSNKINILTIEWR
jgi:hypothetical protein